MKYKEKFKLSHNWKEKIFLVSMFHSKQLLRTKNKWKVRDTANYFNVSIGLISENLMLAREIESIDDCKSRASALRKLNQ